MTDMQAQEAVGVIVGRFHVPQCTKAIGTCLTMYLHARRGRSRSGRRVRPDRSRSAFIRDAQADDRERVSPRVFYLRGIRFASSFEQGAFPRARRIDRRHYPRSPRCDIRLARQHRPHLRRRVRKRSRRDGLHGKRLGNTRSFGAGQLDGLPQGSHLPHVRHKKALPAVDIAVMRHTDGKLLWSGKRRTTARLRFPGVFLDPSIDDSFEQAGTRCIGKEAPGVEIRHPHIVSSAKVDDWRYRRSSNRVISVLLYAEWKRGDPSVGEGVDSVEWVDMLQALPRLVERTSRSTGCFCGISSGMNIRKWSHKKSPGGKNRRGTFLFGD